MPWEATLAEVIRLRPAPVVRQAIELTVARDEYSVRVTAPDDPRFWVRVEHGTVREPIVTDFNPGELGDDLLVEGLSQALRHCCAGGLNTLTFRDVVPGGAGPHYGPRLLAARVVAEKAARRMAEERGQTVESVKFEENRGKLDVRVAFG